MTTLQTIQQTLAPELRLLNERIQATLDSPNALMNSVVHNYLEKKREADTAYSRDAECQIARRCQRPGDCRRGGSGAFAQCLADT